jgi:hypothetical protein
MYNVSSSAPSVLGPRITNPPPFCANLFSASDAPYAFHHVPLKRKGKGFPVWLDVQYDANTAAALIEYIKEGLYIDVQTRQVLVHLCTYNPFTHIFARCLIRFKNGEGGQISASSKVSVIKV